MTDMRGDTSPLNARFALESIIDGLACDLAELRQKKISVNDALARAALAKQIMNGVRLFVVARKSWEQDMQPLPPPPKEERHGD